MSKSETIYQIAIDAGLPDNVTVTYHRGGRVWYVQHPIPMGTSAEIGNPSTIIGNYDSVQAARDRLPTDARNFWQQYGRALALVDGDLTSLTRDEARLLVDALRGGVSAAPHDDYKQMVSEGIVKTAPQLGSQWLTYTLTALGERIVQQSIEDLHTLTERHDNTSHRDISPADDSHEFIAQRDTPPADDDSHELIAKRDTPPAGGGVIDPTEDLPTLRDAMHTLLDSVGSGQPVAPSLVEQATAYLAHLESLHSKHDATGRYTTRHPDADKTPIYWQQPTNRKAPIYTHEITCPYCGRDVTLHTHSPKTPGVCEREDCQRQHTRALARERKRRQRSRGKSHNDTKT